MQAWVPHLQWSNVSQHLDEGAARCGESLKGTKSTVPVFFSQHIWEKKHVLITRIAKWHAMMLIHQLRERHGGHIFTFQNSKPWCVSTNVLARKEPWEAAWNHLWNRQETTKNPTVGCPPINLKLWLLSQLQSIFAPSLIMPDTIDSHRARSKARHALTHPTHPAWSHCFVCQLSNSPLWNLLPASGVETWRSLWTLFSCHRPIKRDPRDPPSKSSKTSYSIYATLERCKSWKMVQKIKMQPEVMQSSGILGNWGKTASWLLVAAIESSNSSEGKESVSRRPCFMKPKRSLLPVILGAGIATWHDQQTFFVMTMTTILMTVRFEHAYYDDFDDEVW